METYLKKLCIERSYSSLTKKKTTLETRLNEHIKDINKKSISLSVVLEYKLYEKHEFNWENVYIVNSEPSYLKRTVSEMIYIKK